MGSTIEDFFDNESASYRTNVLMGSSGNEYLSSVEVEYFLDVLSKLDKKNISLDIGVGNGRFTNIMATHFSRVVSMDISKEMIEQSKNYMSDFELDKVLFINGNFEKYKFNSDDHYDFITSFRVFKYFSDMEAAIEKHSNLLYQGGTSVIQFPNSNSYQSVIYLFRNFSILGKKNNNYLNSLKLVSIQGIVDTYEKNGMVIHDIMYGSILPYFMVARVNNSILIKLIAWIDKKIQKSFLKKFCRDFVIYAEKTGS